MYNLKLCLMSFLRSVFSFFRSLFGRTVPVVEDEVTFVQDVETQYEIPVPEKVIDMGITRVPFSETNFYKVSHPKRQIVLHHTVSSPDNSQAVANYWETLKDHIATCYVQAFDGNFIQLFDDNYWGHHLGVTAASLKAQGFPDSGSRNVLLNQQSVAVEICAWGGLVLGDGRTVMFNGKAVAMKPGVFYNAYGSPVDVSLGIEEVSWRGFKYFQRYSDRQIDGLGVLLSDLMKRYGISSAGLKDGNFDIRRDALSGHSGIFSHSNYRADKSDLYPDKRIVQMLKNL